MMDEFSRVKVISESDSYDNLMKLYVISTTQNQCDFDRRNWRSFVIWSTKICNDNIRTNYEGVDDPKGNLFARLEHKEIVSYHFHSELRNCDSSCFSITSIRNQLCNRFPWRHNGTLADLQMFCLWIRNAMGKSWANTRFAVRLVVLAIWCYLLLESSFEGNNSDAIEMATTICQTTQLAIWINLREMFKQHYLSHYWHRMAEVHTILNCMEIPGGVMKDFHL
jgi:hypothetical protein